MCLAVPAKLVNHEGDQALADLHGNRVQINMALVPEATAGDWVLVHAGFAIQRLEPEAAVRTWSVLEDLDEQMAADSAHRANQSSDGDGSIGEPS